MKVLARATKQPPSGCTLLQLDAILSRLGGQSNSLYFQNEQGIETVKSFAELASDVDLLVGRLGEVGVRPGHVIGILAPNSYWWIVWDLACIAAKCLSVALEQTLPADALSDVISRMQLTALASERAWLPENWAHVPGLFAIDDPGLEIGQTIDRPAHRYASGAHSLAFSSGTTGRTKGLIIGARGTENLCRLYHEAYGISPGDFFLTFLPFANFQQRATYYFCLYYGLDFVAVPLSGLFPALRRYKPTFIIAPPMFYEKLQALVLAGGSRSDDREGDAERLRHITGGRIRYMITGMAPIRRNTMEFFWQNDVCLYEAFGVTEAGMVTWNKPGRSKLGTVGTPAEPGSVTLAADGEVVITRDELWCLGYFDASDEDARATFIGPRSVATGDIAEWDSDGFLVIIGRKKDAIVTRSGEKFLPEMVEAKIQTCPAARLAVVVGGDEIAGITAIVLIATDAKERDEALLRRYVDEINRSLPAYQQVKRVVVTEMDFTVENGLRTRNLKLDRRAIKAKFASQLQHVAS